MYQINSKSKITGIYVRGHVDEPYSDALYPQEVYSVTVLPNEGLTDEELNMVFESEAGFHTRLEKPSWVDRHGYITFSSVLKPHSTLTEELHDGDSVTVSFKPIMNYTPDHESAYGELQLIGIDIDKHDPDEGIDLTTTNYIDI